MNACDLNSFDEFEDPGNYPQPVSNFTPTQHPTNSWAQNAITNNLDEGTRTVNVGPWYANPYYNNKGQIGIVFDSALNENISITLDNGNFSYQYNPSPNIQVGIYNGNGSKLELHQVDDFTALFALTFGNNVTNCEVYLNRGNPFTTLLYDGDDVDIVFKAQGIVSTTSLSNHELLVTTNGSKVTSVTESMYFDVTSLLWTTKFLRVYDGTTPTTDEVKVTLDSNIARFQLLDLDLSIDLGKGAPIGTLPSGVVYFGGYKATVQGFQITDQGINYTIVVDTNTKIVTFTKSVPTEYQWLFYTDVGTLTNPETNRLHITNYTGVVQMACLGAGTSHASLITLLQSYYAYTKSGKVTNFTISGFDVEFLRQGTAVEFLMLLPSHWNDYTITGVTALTQTYEDISYGTMKYYKVTQNTVTVGLGTFNPPLNPDVSSFTTTQQNKLKDVLLEDISGLTIQTSANPYTFGQQAASIGKACVLAKELSTTLGSSIDTSTLLGTLWSQNILKWLQGTNSTVYKLVYEPKWGGIIVPADAIAKPGTSDPTAYGNSFYNDHHFHYGYFLYAVWCLEFCGDYVSNDITYKQKINNILCDVCNPDDGTNFSVKMRHKDFYRGHSWATGIVNSVVRQQESSSEAINCYYACYLLANILVGKGVDVAKYTKIRDAAKVALKLELDASNAYYQLVGPGTKIGDFSTVASIGMMQSQGKAFTLDWNMQPDTFPGRTLGLYGIQSIPITDISFSQVTPIWSGSLNAGTLDPKYKITPTLVLGLTDSQYTPLLQKTNPLQPIFNTSTEGSFWGNVGMELLAPDQIGVTNAQIHQMWMNLYQTRKPLKQFDTYSNTLYWIMRNGRMIEEGLDAAETTTKIADIETTITHPNQEETEKIVLKIPSYNCYDCRHTTFCVQINLDIASLMKGEENAGLSEKALAFDVHPQDLVNYAVTVMTLAYRVYCKLDTKYLSEGFYPVLVKDVAASESSFLLSLLKKYPDFYIFFL